MHAIRNAPFHQNCRLTTSSELASVLAIGPVDNKADSGAVQDPHAHAGIDGESALESVAVKHLGSLCHLHAVKRVGSTSADERKEKRNVEKDHGLFRKFRRVLETSISVCMILPPRRNVTGIRFKPLR